MPSCILKYFESFMGDFHLSYFLFKIKLMEECILNLQNEADIKSNEVKALEKALLLIDDNSKREKYFVTQMLTSRVLLTNQVSRKRTNLVLNRLKELTDQRFDLEESIKFLTSLHDEVEKLDEVENELDEKIELDDEDIELDDEDMKIGVMSHEGKNT